MRILRVRLPAFKNLQDFSIEFDRSTGTTLIVGRNGSGKSNLIEALVRIFRDLDRGFKGKEKSAFPFDIEYEIRGDIVRVDHDPARDRDHVLLHVNGEIVRPAQFFTGERRYLPETLFAYYSGPSNRLEELFDESLAEFRDAMINNDFAARQRLIYGRPIHSKFVLLSFFSEANPETKRFMSDYLGIDDIESTLFVLKQPYWGAKQGVGAKADFWGAKGVVRRFLFACSRFALAPLQLDVRIPVGIKRVKSEERVFLYLPDREALAALVRDIAGAGNQGPARELFKTLESAYVSDLISDVRISVRKRNLDGTVTFRELSEGEQQLLMVLGLLRFTKDEESLFLLDEPDTHLNPVWSQRFLELIERTVSRDDTSQVLIATHDPVAISMLTRRQVRQLAAPRDDGHVIASPPDDDPIKIGISGVLMSELFGLRSMLAPHIVSAIARRRVLLGVRDRTPAQSAELAVLNEELKDVELTSLVSDPRYAEFLRASTKADLIEVARKPSFTPGEVQQRRELTEKLLQEIVEEKS